MPRQNKTKSKSAQAKSSQSDAKAFQRAVEQRRKQLARDRREFTKQKDKELKGIAKAIRGMGIYEPKALIMTPYRRKRLRSVEREFKPILDGKHFLIPIRKQDRKHAIQRAESLGIEHTKSGFILPKGGYKKAVLKRNSRGELFIERKGKTKSGVNKGRIYRDVTPLASADELDKERDRIRRAVRRLGKFEGKDKLAFVVEEDGTEGPGTMFFDNVEDLIKWLNGYVMNTAAHINFLRHVRVMKITQDDFRKKYPPKDRAKPRKIAFKKSGKFDTRGTK